MWSERQPSFDFSAGSHGAENCVEDVVVRLSPEG